MKIDLVKLVEEVNEQKNIEGGVHKINKLLDQWLKSREVILSKLNSQNDLDIKTVIMKGKQLEDLNAKITVLVLLKSD